MLGTFIIFYILRIGIQEVIFVIFHLLVLVGKNARSILVIDTLETTTKSPQKRSSNKKWIISKSFQRGRTF